MDDQSEKQLDDLKWWRDAVIYQVYWRSFLDTNGDGIGDLRGVIQKLDYIKELGADIIWLNPMYASPDLDNGYDISDYEAIMPKAGTMADVDELIEQVHQRDLKIIMDLVVNHTSDQHDWFQESRSSRHNSKHDWYIWRDAKADGSAPNNWPSYFATSCWTFDEMRGQYYFHSFAKEQPDLNWANPALRTAIYEMMHRWFQKGIDGFRMDAICMIAKPDSFADAEHPNDLRILKPSAKLHDYLQEMHQRVLVHYDVFTVGEAAMIDEKEGALLLDPDRRELDTLFHFEVCDDLPRWDLPAFRSIQNRWSAALGTRSVVAQFLNNHDHVRHITRYGDDSEAHRLVCAKMFALLIHTLPGIPTIYQGEEIGMTGITFSKIEDYQDILTIHRYHMQIAGGAHPEQALAVAQQLSRDQSRTPMQWDANAQAGFTSGTPWLPVNPNYRQLNVLADREADDSIFRFYQQLIGLRKQTSILAFGDYADLSNQHPQVYCYVRSYRDKKWYVILNTSSEPIAWPVAQQLQERVVLILLDTHMRFGELYLAETLNLRAYEGLLVEFER